MFVHICWIFLIHPKCPCWSVGTVLFAFWLKICKIKRKFGESSKKEEGRDGKHFFLLLGLIVTFWNMWKGVLGCHLLQKQKWSLFCLLGLVSDWKGLVSEENAIPCLSPFRATDNNATFITSVIMMGLRVRDVDPSSTLGSMIWCFASANMRACAHRGVSEGDVPLRSWKVLYFCNRNHAIWWILLSANLEQTTKPKFCIFGEIFGKILL